MEKITVKIPNGARIGPKQKPIYGYSETAAYTNGGGLCVHRALSGKGWNVTHVASGYKIGPLCATTKKRALANMAAALALDFDWTLPEQEAFAALRASRGIVDSCRAIGA